MKLRIENSKATHAHFTKHFKSPVVLNNCVQVEIEVPKQELNHWCWAAIAVASSSYYQQKEIKQVDLVSSYLGFDCTAFKTDPAIEKNCNINQKLDKVLEQVATFSHWSFNKPTFERIQYEINHGHPIAMRIEWIGSGGHYILIKGYETLTKRLLIADPMHGESLQSYDIFPKKYLGKGGFWTDTYWFAKTT